MIIPVIIGELSFDARQFYENGDWLRYLALEKCKYRNKIHAMMLLIIQAKKEPRKTV